MVSCRGAFSDLLGLVGESTKEIINLTNDILYRVENKFFIKKDIGDVEISQAEYEIIYAFSIQESYRGFPSGRRQYFKGDEQFLFRLTAKNDVSREEEDIINIIKDLVPIKRNRIFLFVNLS
jgi:hypothetical protein